MAVPSFLNTSYYYLELAGVTDVQTIIDEFDDQVLLHNDPAWTEPVAGTYKSPPLTDGQFFSVVLSRISATRLGFKVTDFFGNTICDRALDIDAAGTTVRIMTGQCHAVIDSARATPECGIAALVDLSPDVVGLQMYRTIGWGTRDTSGTVNSSGADYWYMWDNASAALLQRGDTHAFGTACITSKTLGGASVFTPVYVFTNIFGSNPRWIGRAFQLLLVPDNLAHGAEVDVPIDSGVTGKFRVIGRTAQTYGHWKCAVRRTTP